MASTDRPFFCFFLLWAMTLVRTYTPDEGLSLSPVLQKATTPSLDTKMNITESPTNYTGLSCASLLPPRRGSFYVEKGRAMSLGTVLAFWCLEGYQLVGSEKISCVLRSNTPQWSNYPPDCEAIPKPEDRGLRVAVLASVVSSIVIFAMSVSFIICCLQERMSKARTERCDGRRRMRDKHKSWRSECWLEQEEGAWEAFPPPKIYNLSQHLDSHRSFDTPAYMGGLTGYDNRGYQRSQENLLKATLPGLYHSESQVYPHVVIQRAPTPTLPTAPSAPRYLRPSSPPPKEKPTGGNILPSYPKPSYHTPSGTPQHLWP